MSVPPTAVAAALWIAWGVYWIAASRGKAAAEQSEAPLSRAVHLVLLGAAFYCIFGDPPAAVLHSRLVPAGPAVGIAGLAVEAAGLLFAVWARIHLGRNWSGAIAIQSEQRLIRSGPYRLARHPIYTGFVVGVLGSALVRNRLAALLALALVVAAYMRKIHLEERTLAAHFGEEYERYRREVKALVPWVL